MFSDFYDFGTLTPVRSKADIDSTCWVTYAHGMNIRVNTFALLSQELVLWSTLAQRHDASLFQYSYNKLTQNVTQAKFFIELSPQFTARFKIA